MDCGEDVVGSFGPDKGTWVLVDGLDVADDGGFELFRRAMDAAADLTFAEVRKEALDLVLLAGGVLDFQVGIRRRLQRDVDTGQRVVVSAAAACASSSGRISSLVSVSTSAPGNGREQQHGIAVADR